MHHLTFEIDLLISYSIFLKINKFNSNNSFFKKILSFYPNTIYMKKKERKKRTEKDKGLSIC